METSNLFKALVAAQAEMPSVQMDGVNPHFKSRYATLSAIMQAVRPVLARHGLAVVQLPVADSDSVRLRTIIVHTSGESVESEAAIKPERPGPHAYGSALTYLRRYALAAALGVVSDDDDDGNGAKHEDKPAAPAKPQPVNLAQQFSALGVPEKDFPRAYDYMKRTYPNPREGLAALNAAIENGESWDSGLAMFGKRVE